MMSTGQRIKERRKSLLLSAETLAQKIGVSPATVYRWEKGEIEKVPMTVLPTLSAALQTSPEYLMGWSDNAELSASVVSSIPAPDFENAATKAAEMLVRFRISSAPVLPLQILNSLPGVLVRSFTEFADESGLDRKELVFMYGAETQDAVTISRFINGKPRYIVAYNQRMPFYTLQLALARELAFVSLGTNEFRHDDPRMVEALCFTRHLLCPRPLIQAISDAGLSLSVESVGSLTGCYGRCLAGIRETPGVRVAAGLNRLIRQQFASFVENLIDFETLISGHDDSPAADFGTYMEAYEE